MIRSLVAGGAGFIGSYLCERLLETGRRVLCVDDFSTGAASNLEGLRDHPHFELLERDVTDPFDAAADEIFDLACPAAPIHYQRDPVRTLRTSVYGAVNLLELARRSNARILLASTSEVYGDPEVHPQVESYRGNVDPVGPRACYNEGKRAAEALFRDSRRMHGLDTRIARLFNTYGPRMQADDGRVVPAFIVRALSGEPLEVHGGGTQTRSFCYVDDVVDGLLRLMDADEAPEPVNLGNPEEISILELARRIRSLAKSTSDIRHLPPLPDDPRRRRPDVSRAAEQLGWKPRTGLEAGLEATIAWFRTHSKTA